MMKEHKHIHQGHGHRHKRERANREHFLEVEDLVVTYHSEGSIVHAVNRVSLKLDRGKTLALVGETGAGKTTIAKAILQILPDRGARINGGKIWLDGANLLSFPENDMRKVRGAKISMIFQDPMTALNPTMRIGDQIAEVIAIHDNVSKANAKLNAIRMLEAVGITRERYEEYPHQFSGGMKQRVVIAMALACSPEMLLADEPTSALDVTIQAQILGMISDLRSQYHTAMILITHDLGVVAQTADDVAIIYAGEIVEYGSKEDIFDHPQHPYTVGLFNAIPNLETDTRRLANIEGLPPDPTNLPKGCCFSSRCPYATQRCIAEKPEPRGHHHFCKCFRKNTEAEASNE